MHDLHQHDVSPFDAVCYEITAELEATQNACKCIAKFGVWREMNTGRIDVLDIYRLGFKLSRRGGVQLKRDGEMP